MNPEQQNQFNPAIPQQPPQPGSQQPMAPQQYAQAMPPVQQYPPAPSGNSQPGIQPIQQQTAQSSQPITATLQPEVQQEFVPMQPKLMALKHHILWVIVGVVLFMLIGIGAFIASGVSGVTFDEYSTYTDSSIQMLYPLDWQVDNAANTAWTFSSGASLEESVAAIEVSQIAFALPQYEIASEAEKDVLVASLISSYRADIDAQPPAGFTSVDQSKFDVGKHPAADRSVTFSLSGVNSLGVSVKGAGDVIITDSGNVFVIFAAAEQNVWDLNATNFEEMLNSFKVR